MAAGATQHLERGAYNILSQAGIESGYDVVSEFALDILRAFGLKKGERGARHNRGSSTRKDRTC
jgi:hypothetical protein